LDSARSFCVSLCGFYVLTAVEFNNQPDAAAAEIAEIARNRELPGDLQAGELRSAKLRPEKRFCSSRLIA
jgi:hypothetical protein